MIEKEKILEIKKFAKQARKNILDMSLSAGASSSHFGGSLSTVEIISTLYNKNAHEDDVINVNVYKVLKKPGVAIEDE